MALVSSYGVQAETKLAEQPLRIVADEMDCDQQTNICTATGNAFVQKMNDPKNQTISATKLIAYFKKKEKKEDTSQPASSSSEEKKGFAENTSIDKIEAIGDVVLADSESIIKCDSGTYYADTDTADFVGNVSLTQGKNELTGTRGFANLKEGKYQVRNESGRVEGLFYQKEK